jgi:DNA helicase II / ATP-dependent DNA helicase PcrA
MEPDKLEEERRLCYVGITRAMSKLFLTCAQVRRLHGIENYRAPSKFLREIPAHLINTCSSATLSYPKTSQPRATPQQAFKSNAAELKKTSFQSNVNSKWQIGQKVSHQKFGAGKILDVEGRDEHAKIKVNFESYGVKWLVAMYANLQG